MPEFSAGQAFGSYPIVPLHQSPRVVPFIGCNGLFHAARLHIAGKHGISRLAASCNGPTGEHHNGALLTGAAPLSCAIQQLNPAKHRHILQDIQQSLAKFLRNRWAGHVGQIDYDIDVDAPRQIM